MNIQMQSSKEYEVMKEMRSTGVSYQEIGNRFGVSRQMVHYILKSRGGSKPDEFRNYRYSSALKEYPLLRKYLVENGMDIKELAEMCGIAPVRLRMLLNQKRKWREDELDNVKAVVGQEMYREIYTRINAN